MKKLFRYIGLFMSVLMLGAMTSCNIEENLESADLGLGIKVFSPTKVVAGQPMTINGSGLADVTEIVFPDGVAVTDFEIVSNEMIRVNAPKGINAEGGKLIVRSEADEAQSEQDLTVGKTVISGYSSQEGETLTGRDNLTIYGTDLEFINAVEFQDGEGNTIRVGHESFYRKGTSTVIITIPDNVLDGAYVAHVFTFDGQDFSMPEFVYAHFENGGHWEIQKNVLWENDGTPITSWGGTFRFGLEGTDGNNECIHTFPADQWAIIKDGVVRVAVEVSESSNIRITTGWWSAAYGGTDHNCLDMVQEDEDGTKYIELNIKEEGTIYDMIDQQHLLFTGDAYTILYFYTQEEVWVEGEGGHWERNSFWKNEEGTAVLSWGGTFRFGLEGTDGNNECIHTFPADQWAIIKDGVVHVAVEVSESSNIRITTGWWSAAYGGTDHNCIDMIQEEEDGTKYIELNIKEEGTIYDMIDQQHLLFTGDAYTILEIYVNEWVEGGGDVDPEIDLKDHITYEQPDPAFSYPYYPSWSDNTGKLRVKRDNGLKDLGLQAGKSKFIFYKTAGTTGQIQINDPNWTQLTTVADWDGSVEVLEYVLDEAAIKCVTGETSDGWSETAFVLQGDGLEVTKITVLP